MQCFILNKSIIGGRVILAARQTELCQSAIDEVPNAASRASVLHVDLASLKSCRDFVDKLKQTKLNINILILNAAYLGSKRKTEDGFEYNFGVNHLSLF